MVRLATIPRFGRNRISAFWAPSGGITPSVSQENDPHALLIRAGFLRQAYSGIFHLLPLGLRVQDKLQNLVDRHMRSIGASKLSLSSISSSELWQKTGRLDQTTSELLRIKDRKNSDYLLSPTHEEEITALVKNAVKSYKDLPLRLYQIGRKYRDELRPRQGLLRTKEFLMKDLYTFDVSPKAAVESYAEVTDAYEAFFDDLQLPYAVAKADSGNMGGNMSHEYHFLTSQGEDDVVSCNKCGYCANEEVAEKDTQTLATPAVMNDRGDLGIWIGVTKDKATLVMVFFPKVTEISDELNSPEAVNPRSVAKLVPQLDLSIENATQTWATANPDNSTNPRSILHIYDLRISSQHRAKLRPTDKDSWIPSDLRVMYSQADSVQEVAALDTQGAAIDLMRIKDGDHCRYCSGGSLRIERGIEVGHTFHLGTRYSEPLNAVTSTPTQNAQHLQMGCHGIGLSRLVGAVATVASGSYGLKWPRAIAPFDIVIITPKNSHELEDDIGWLYDALTQYNINQGDHLDRSSEVDIPHNETAVVKYPNKLSPNDSVPGESCIDPVVDDRQKDIGWKLKDAQLIGYPVSVLLGKAWSRERLAEVRCPTLGSNDLIPAEDLVKHVAERLLAYMKNANSWRFT